MRGAPPLNIAIENQVSISNNGTNWKFIFMWRKINCNWHVLQIPKAHFSYSIWLMISDKSIMLCYGVHVSSSWWCMHVPRVSANKAYKKNCLQEFPILLALNYYTFMCTCDFYRYEHVYTYRKKEFQNILESKKNMQLAWTVATCLILNIELYMILIVLTEFACIRHSWILP